GNAMLVLLDHPEALATVRADRAPVPALIAEVLRYDSPIQAVFRQTTEAGELDGGKLPGDATVLLGSANRDERKFPDPDCFAVARNPPIMSGLAMAFTTVWGRRSHGWKDGWLWRR